MTWSDLSGIQEETFSYNIVSQNTSPPNSLVIEAHSPVNILLTDSAGRKLGSDGVNDYNQIPGAFYTGTGRGFQIAGLQSGIPGQYTIQVNRTGPDSFVLMFVTTDSSGNILGSQTLTGTTNQGSIKSFILTLASDGSISVTTPSPTQGVPEFPYGSMGTILLVAAALPMILIISRKVARITVRDFNCR